MFNNYESEFNTKALLVTVLGVLLVGLLAYNFMPNVLSLINSKITIMFNNFINSQI